MSNAIVTVIMTALMLAGVSILAQGSFSAVDEVSESWKGMEIRSAEAARVDLSVVSVAYATPTLDVTLSNTGDESLRDFAKWDVFVRYYETDGTLRNTYLDYTTSSPVSDNEWTKLAIYQDSAAGVAESYEPTLFNHGEEMVLRLQVSPDADSGGNNVVVIGTANGVTVSKPF